MLLWECEYLVFIAVCFGFCFLILTKRLAGKSISKMTCFVTSGL